MKICFIDIETTGLNSKKDKITELSAIIRVDGRIEGEINLTGLSEKAIYARFTEFIEKYVDKFDKEDKMFFAGWNSGFDMNFVRELFTKFNDKFFGSYFWNPYYDVMQVALHKLRTKRHKVENFKLSTVAKYLGIRVVESRLHSANYDTRLCKDIYNIVYK